MMRIFLVSLSLILFFFSTLNANEKIVFVDIDRIIYESNLGKKISKKMNSEYKAEEKRLVDIEKKLKEKENDIAKKKNVLSKEELNKKISVLRNEINEFKKERFQVNEKFKKERLSNVNKMVESLNEILAKYSSEKSISMIIQRKNIVIGKSDLDITDEVMSIFNKEVKSLK
tara:strand:+ start:197 stop:712 length:516 start_codon:yes stop_codon:yes gene_type:complete